jgi:hypothetical protein
MFHVGSPDLRRVRGEPVTVSKMHCFAFSKYELVHTRQPCAAAGAVLTWWLTYRCAGIVVCDRQSAIAASLAAGRSQRADAKATDLLPSSRSYGGRRVKPTGHCGSRRGATDIPTAASRRRGITPRY